MRLHFLPPYCPDENRIERIWLDLHANVTRNHQCQTMDELMKEVRHWLRKERISLKTKYPFRDKARIRNMGCPRPIADDRFKWREILRLQRSRLRCLILFNQTGGISHFFLSTRQIALGDRLICGWNRIATKLMD